MKPLKIAIYSGAIPSTTFIENLIKGLAAAGQEVLLFGKLHRQVDYGTSSIHLYPTPEAKWRVILFVLRQQLQLGLKSRQQFRLLKQHIRTIESSPGNAGAYGQNTCRWCFIYRIYFTCNGRKQRKNGSF
ncbi:MAG: hypothetical protein IPJ74_09165 [Saprospiraceae bacterium]|nr:hypothetical protein [Saprospiraceae bacterium]